MSTLLFLGQPEWGHTNPTLPVVAELVRRGERVIYYSLEGFQSAIADTGAIFRSYGEAFPYDPARAYENQMKHLEQNMCISERVLARLLPRIHDERPDAILHDQLAVWGSYVAQALDVPAICCMPMFVILPRLILSDPTQMRNRLSSAAEPRHIREIASRLSATYSVRRVSLFDLANNPGQLNMSVFMVICQVRVHKNLPVEPSQ
jgi:MGT family glycosyltransferase